MKPANLNSSACVDFGAESNDKILYSKSMAM